MQKRADENWVGYVLRDVVTFLVENEMMDSARMLAVAAAHIEHDLRRQALGPQATNVQHANVLAFPLRKRIAN